MHVVDRLQEWATSAICPFRSGRIGQNPVISAQLPRFTLRQPGKGEYENRTAHGAADILGACRATMTQTVITCVKITPKKLRQGNWIVAAVEVDLGALGVRLPRGEVAMVVAQPHVVFVPQEPFTWAPAERQRALECIDDTLVVSRTCPHGADKTHFTVFPKCTLPGLVGVERITAAMQAVEWPTETIVIGGLDGLTKAQFTELVQRPNTTYDAVGNCLDRVQAHQWVNCVVIWAKLPTGEVRSWVQPKLSLLGLN